MFNERFKKTLRSKKKTSIFFAFPKERKLELSKCRSKIKRIGKMLVCPFVFSKFPSASITKQCTRVRYMYKVPFARFSAIIFRL